MLVIVPSRGRPENVKRLVDAFESTTRNGSHLLVAVDDDDPRLTEYLELEKVWMNISPRTRLGPTLNELSLRHAYAYEIIGFMGDDHLPKTDGWDLRITEALAGRAPGVAYGNDLVHGEAIPTAAFLTTDIIRILGYFVPPGMVHLFLDNYWKTLGESLDSLHYMNDVIIQHMHPIAGNAEWDETYREANADSVWEGDERRFNEYVANELADDVRKLRGSTTIR